VRITAQLIDAQSGTHLWADRFDGSLEDVFELQEQVAISVAGVIEPTLQTAETRRAARRPTSDLDAYDLYLRALAELWSVGDKDKFLRALDFVSEAIGRDPRYAPALASAAYCHVYLFWEGWRGEPDKARRDAVRLARRAIEAADGDPSVLANAAYVLGATGEDINTAKALVGRSLALNPSSVRGWYISAVLRLWAGELDLAIEHAQTCLRLSPRGAHGSPVFIIGNAHFLGRRFDRALEHLLLGVQEHPSSTWQYRILAACYAQIRQRDEARESIARLLTMTTVVLPPGTLFRKPEHQELFLSGLRVAMGEET